MKVGLQLPQVDLGGGYPTMTELSEAVTAAAEAGFAGVAVNDNSVFRSSWLDGPTLLSAVVLASRPMKLLSLVLPSIRGPVPTARYLATLDLLSGGRVIAATASGSSDAALIAAGIDPDDRWRRFESDVATLTDLIRAGKTESIEQAGIVTLEPAPRPDLPIWMASWGSPAGLDRVARHGDGWLASGYNMDPTRFRRLRDDLQSRMTARDRPSANFEAGLTTLFVAVEKDRAAAHRILSDVLEPLLSRSAAELEDQLLVGSAEFCAERLEAYREAGLDWAFLLPISDPRRQVALLASDVLPRLGPA